MIEHVLLLHGVWMRGLTLQPLAWRLRRAGFAVETIDYASVFVGHHVAMRRLRERMRAIDADAVHLVGHSLGALVALETVRGMDALPPGRIVCLGPPLRGSAVARNLAALPGGRWLLGHSGDALIGGVPAWDGSRDVGVVAGRLPIGFGSALVKLEPPHDGTVTVAETRLRGIGDHRVVNTSHTGMLVSVEVAELTGGFLRDGRFGAVDAETAQVS